jgi:hypothetical protein
MWRLEAGKLKQSGRIRRRALRRRRINRAASFARALVGLLIAGYAAAGCYKYVPVSVGSVDSKEAVRVRITEQAAARLAAGLGSYSQELDGEFSQQGPDSVSLGVPIDRTYRGTTVGTTTQLLYLGRSEVVEVRRRTFSRGRTLLVTTGTAVGFAARAAGVAWIGDTNSPSGETPPPPPPSGVRRPTRHLLTLRIPLL